MAECYGVPWEPSRRVQVRLESARRKGDRAKPGQHGHADCEETRLRMHVACKTGALSTEFNHPARDKSAENPDKDYAMKKACSRIFGRL